MKLSKVFAVLMAAFICISAMAVNVSAASKKSVKLNKSKITLEIGDSYTLKKTVTGFSKYTVQWSSSDKKIAAVKSGGVVTAKKAGTATITMKIKGTKYKATCKVTVKKAGSSSQKTTTTTTTVKKTTTQKTTSSSGSAQALIDKMTIGWNLGNTLDCSGCTWLSNKLDCETAWGNIKTTKAMIDTVKKAGFNTVRIPVSWNDHIDSNGKIDTKWLDRVQEVVDYAYDNDMYVILNTHHENGWVKLDSSKEKEIKKKFTYVWKQIATRFKDYDEKLLFEGLNEPRTEGSAQEWNGGTAAERKVLNSLYQGFVDTVRATGGNNKTRILILTPYGANSGKSALSDLWLPEDDDRIAVSVHAYLPYNTALNTNSAEKTLTDSGKREIDNTFSNINSVLLSKGIPVIMDEFGTINKSNTDERIEIAEYYLSVAEKYGVPCVWWDNGTNCSPKDGEGFGLLNRKTLKWYYPDIVKALVNAVK
ncbi:MAG: cellulase family glycosylhydrolase [Oscillospiraceae bacterium]|nr:cellulase family glycosylhydrolase [Oscillospiraceae bacterium]